MSTLSTKTVGGYWLTLRGGPFNGRTLNYAGLPETLVLMTRPFVYHDYRRIGDSNHYEYVERQTDE